jgi:hypothetical protein
METRPHSLPSVAPTTVQAVVREVRGHAIKSAHYVGTADEGLIRALKDEMGQGLTIMDYFDRWGGSARFFGEGDGLPLPPCPDWLQDVPSYQEGCPEADLLLFDLSGKDAEFLLRELLAPPLRRRPFQHVALVGSAAPERPRVLGYQWEQKGEFWSGKAIS